MEWLEIVLGALGGSLTAFIGSILYFRPKLKEAKANANKADTEAADARLNSLLGRIESAEKLYKQQGEMLDSVREKVLQLGQELQEKNQRIVLLESENKTLTTKVNQLEKEVAAYKTISGK